MVADVGPLGGCEGLLPARAVDAGVDVRLLAEVDQVGVEEDAHRHQDDQEPQLLVRLLQGVEQRLQPGKVTHQLKYSGTVYFNYTLETTSNSKSKRLQLDT